MRVSFKSLLVAGLALGAVAYSASAATVTISSTVPESGFIGAQNLPSYPLTGTPYDFTADAATVASLTSVDALTVTLTINDADTGAGDFDFNNLFLGLDSINTGLALNGFINNNIVTLTLNQLSPATGAAILAALQADNKLVGSVIDLTPANAPAGDIIGFPALVDTTLDITGTTQGGGPGPNPIPLPAAVLLAPLGAGLAGLCSRRFRRQ